MSSIRSQYPFNSVPRPRCLSKYSLTPSSFATLVVVSASPWSRGCVAGRRCSSPRRVRWRPPCRRVPRCSSTPGPAPRGGGRSACGPRATNTRACLVTDGSPPVWGLGGGGSWFYIQHGRCRGAKEGPGYGTIKTFNPAKFGFVLPRPGHCFAPLTLLPGCDQSHICQTPHQLSATSVFVLKPRVNSVWGTCSGFPPVLPAGRYIQVLVSEAKG